MSAPNSLTPDRGRRVSAQARQVAARLSALFEQDSLIVGRLNDAQRRLSLANGRLWSGLAPDALGLIYDGIAPAGHSQIAALADASAAGEPGSQTAVLCALQQAHWTIHRAFRAYQDASEQRRQLAFEVGECSQQLTQTLRAAGWSVHEAHRVDVHELAQAPA